MGRSGRVSALQDTWSDISSNLRWNSHAKANKSNGLIYQNIKIAVTGFSPMWYVRPAKPQTSMRICTVCSEHLLGP